MKKRSWSKQLLIAGSIMAVAFACQCQKTPEMKSPATEQNEPDQDEDETCDQKNSSPVQEESAPAAQTEANVPAEPVAESAPASPEMQSAPVSETNREKAEGEAPRLEAVQAVSENQAPATPDRN